MIAALVGLNLTPGKGKTDLVSTGVPTELSTEAPTSGPLDPTISSTTTEEPTTPSTTATAAPSSSAPTSTTASPGTAVPPETTTSAALVCRNSRDARCGPFRYDPPPTNQPTTVEATPSASTVPAGTVVEVHIVAADPDSPIGAYQCAAVRWPDPAVLPGTDCPPYCTMEFRNQYGPWDPRPTRASRYEGTASHTYASPGTYDIDVAVTTISCDKATYVDTASTKLKITVTA